MSPSPAWSPSRGSWGRTAGGRGAPGLRRSPPNRGAGVIAALHRLAQKQGGEDERSRGRRYADALVELATRACDHDDLPTVGGARPHVALIVDLPTLQDPPAPSGPDRLGGLGRRPQPH